MVNIATLAATGAEQGAMPHLTGSSTAGVGSMSFLASLERSVSAGGGKTAMPEGMPVGAIEAKTSALRSGVILVECTGTTGREWTPAEAKKPGGDSQESPCKSSDASMKEIVPASSAKEDLPLGASAGSGEDVSPGKVLLARGPYAKGSITRAGQGRRSEDTELSLVREHRAETAKIKLRSRKDEASIDAAARSGDSAIASTQADCFAPFLVGQTPEGVVPTAVPMGIVQPVQDSNNEAASPNVSATETAVGASTRAQSLRVPALPKQKLAVAGTEGRSGKEAPEDGEVRDKSFHADELSRFSTHQTSAAPTEGNAKPHELLGSGAQVPLSPLMRDQTHTLAGSSAGKDVSVSSHTGVRGEANPFDQPATSVGEHRALAASPTMLEVGVPGGAHGWLKIRAELVGDGVVHASVSSTSTAGTEMLRRELPSLTTYLHQEQVALGSLVVHASTGTHDSFGTSSGFGSGAEGQQQADAQQGRSQQEAGSYREWNESPWADGMEEGGIAAWLPQAMNAGGSWLSVRA
jgi:hypothetical protein